MSSAFNVAPILAAALTLCGAGVLAPYIHLRIKKKLVPAIFFKIAASVLFLLTAGVSILASAGARWEQYKFLFLGVLFGQVLGLLGDYWLDMKDMQPKHHDAYVIAGFTSFHINHVFYIAGLLMTYGAPGRTLLYMAGAGLLLAVVVLATENLMKLKYGKFKGISAAYSVIFGVSIAAALLNYLASKNPQSLIMAIGLVIFLLSDLVLSGTYFGEGKNRPIDIALNYIFYYGGQFTIALSLLAIK